MNRSPPGDVNAGPARFLTTHWSLVLAAGRRGEPASHDALAALCAAYWYPLYAFVRRSGHSADDAQDLTQEFFTRFLDKDYLKSVDRAKGKFRSFLLASVRHFLANEGDRRRAQKRGGGRPVLSLDFSDAEGRYGRDVAQHVAQQPAHTLTPEKLFERRWALTLLDQVLARLRGEHEAAGTLRLFERLKGCLTGAERHESYRQWGAELDLSESAVKVAVHRLRRRYRHLLRDEIGRTLDPSGDVDEEIRGLFAALAE